MSRTISSEPASTRIDPLAAARPQPLTALRDDMLQALTLRGRAALLRTLVKAFETAPRPKAGPIPTTSCTPGSWQR